MLRSTYKNLTGYNVPDTGTKGSYEINKLKSLNSVKFSSKQKEQGYSNF